VDSRTEIDTGRLFFHDRTSTKFLLLSWRNRTSTKNCTCVPVTAQEAGEAPDASDANKKARDDAWKRWKSLLE
jgi:hypothetical protein